MEKHGEGTDHASETGSLLRRMEAGGTKFLCMVASGPDDVRAQISFPTTKPEETWAGRLLLQAHEPFAALGIGTFGPCDLKPRLSRIRLP